jgi:MarR family 2-MHQ and catechol resistance regulon transcriptional repressor
MSASAQVQAPRLWIVLSRCYRAVSQIAERSIGEAGLGLSDFTALEALLNKGPLTITEIQAKVLLATGSMTAAVDRLERKGLLLRKATPSDRRARVLELTPEGKRVVEAAFGRHAVELEAAMAILNGTEKLQLYGLLKKLGLFAAEARGKAGGDSKTTMRKGRFRK